MSKIPVPEWADVIAIDPDGSVWAFEVDAWWCEDTQKWIPVDNYDGLRFVCVAAVPELPIKMAKVAYWEVQSEEGEGGDDAGEDQASDSEGRVESADLHHPDNGNFGLAGGTGGNLRGLPYQEEGTDREGIHLHPGGGNIVAFIFGIP